MIYRSFEDYPKIDTLFRDVLREKCDNLLFEADSFYHFRGLILCKAKCLQYNRLKKKIVVAQFRKSYIQLRCPFFNLMDLLVPFMSHKNSHCKGSFIIFDGCWIKIFITKISSCIKVFNLGGNLAHQYFIFKLMFVIGYNNKFILVRRQLFINYLLKTIKINC